MKRRGTGKLNRAIADWVVLVVDDTPDNLTVVRTVLQFHGAKVYTATNGQNGLDVLRTITPTVILLDIRMPGMDGWTMFKYVRENPETAHIPVIAVTAYAMDTDKEAILEAGFDGYIVKPLNLFSFADDLEHYVAQAIKKHEKSGDTAAQ